MPNLEEEIPAFSMWKMFNETIIPALLNMEYSEVTLQTLSNIVKTKEFSNIFVFNHDPALSFEEYEAVSQKYKAFTVWLLGRFYYLLSCDKLAKMHDLVIEAQLCILQHISITQPHIHTELGAEYLAALKQLNDYHKNEQTLKENIPKLKLQIFLPAEHQDLKCKLDLSPLPVLVSSKVVCLNMQSKTIKFMSQIILHHVEMYSFKEATYQTVDCLLYILEECNFQMKLEVLEIFVELTKRHRFHSSKMPVQFINRFNRFVAYPEQLTYDVYNKKVEVSGAHLKRFEDVLTAFFKNADNLEGVTGRVRTMAAFINTRDVSQALRTVCFQHLLKIQTPAFLEEAFPVEECIKSFVEKNKYQLLEVVEKRIWFEVKTQVNMNCFELNLHNSGASAAWSKLYKESKEKLLVNECKNKCQLSANLTVLTRVVEMLVRIKIKVQNYTVKEKNVSCSLSFFSELDVLSLLLTVMTNHIASCEQSLSSEADELLQNLFVLLPATYLPSDVDYIFNCVAYPLTKKPELIYQTSLGQTKELSKQTKSFVGYMAKQNLSREAALRALYKLMCMVSARLVITPPKNNKNEKMQNMYLAIIKNVLKEKTVSDEISIKLLRFQRLPYVTSNRDRWINEILLPVLGIQHNDSFLRAVIRATAELICMSYSRYIPAVSWSDVENDVSVETVCVMCTKQLKDVMCKHEIIKMLANAKTGFDVVPSINEHFVELEALFNRMLMLFTSDDCRVKICLVEALRAFSHVHLFHTLDVTKLWLKFADDDGGDVRRLFSVVAHLVVEDVQENQALTKEYKKEMIEVCFSQFEVFTKKSLEDSNSELQNTLLETLSHLATVKLESTPLHIAKLLLYFIMIPTSKYPLIAANVFIEMANQRDITTNLIYSQYKRELSRSIVRLCAINQALSDYNLATSLEKISLILGFFGPKDFVAQECRYLLPILVSLIVIMPQVEKLIHEVASFVDMDLSELLISKYGNIFLHLFLNETDDGFKKSMSYVEKNTGLSGSVLRKRNFQVILNELLLNFHKKRDRVLSAVRILAREDSENKTLSVKQIPEYLQPKFLGVLAYFDMKLIARHSDKKKVLLSLAQLLRFMGPKYITSLRFKILAMLRTALNSNYEVFPELNCDVWDAFVRSCEIEALGPQLASIFVSLLPLMQQLPQKIDDIFKYLVIENEVYVKDYIQDLFFVVETDVNNEICVIIKRHLQRIESLSFKEQLKSFLKYLNHETIDIRVHGLKYLKRLFERNREELDQMILGYNGIDPTIVELLDILMQGCREKEESIKLACGECIGELGAIEPSHLPRQYKQEAKSFMFFITEDGFIVHALNELTRALQAEKNTQNMDRFALAIQEMLKVHGISPDVNSPKHSLWINFPEAQRELMLPLLSSRYTMVQTVESVRVSPIYGSKFGATFQTWVYNWTCNLVLAVNVGKRSLLQVCLPSLKQDHRTLMNFLPHILLHALLESTADIHQKAYDEIMAVLGSLNSRQFMAPTLNVRHMSNSNPTVSIHSATSKEVKENQCTKVIFVLLDFLDRWTREWVWEKGAAAREDAEYQTVKEFLSRFCKLQLARCNCQCGEYARALMYLEEYIKEQGEDLSNQFAFLAELYAELDEADGVTGVIALQHTEPPLEQRLLALEVSGKLADAAACYERIPPPLKPHHLQGLAQCYLDLDNVNTALNFTQGAIATQPEYGNILMETQVEALWRLSRYSELDTLFTEPELKKNNSWGVQIGRALLHLKDGKRDEFKTVLDALRITQVEALGAASLEEGAYQHGYSFIARLHAISELQHIEKIIYELLLRSNDHKVCESLIKQLTSEWKLRLKVVQESIRIQEPILCLRRVGIQQGKQLLETKVPHALPQLNAILGESWLRSATNARAAGVHQQAYTYTLKAEEYAPPRLFLEKAKLHWLKEEHEQALTTLRRGLEVLLPEGVDTPNSSYPNLSLDTKKIAAEAKLLIASYNDSISNVDTDVNKQNYKEAVDMFKEWEKSLVCLAQYYDRIFQTLPEKDKDVKGGDMQIYMINYFGKSLVYGSKFVYQSMPRLLSIWFDYGTRLLDISARDMKADTFEREKMDRENTLLKMTKLVDTFLERLPAYIFLTAFSQLVSRICHPQKQVYIELKNIIIKLILQYPQQSLWMIISVIKSSYSVRSKRCAEILNDSRLKSINMIKLIGDFTKLAEKLIELCNKDIPENVHSTSVSSLLRTLPRLLTKDDFSEIMIPTQKFRKLILPNPDFQSSQHNPFPNHYVHIVGIEDEITVLQSLQHPRKVTFKGSDGKTYIQMLKPKDDLRKDFRLMEFNDIVNQLLSREPDSRQRRLNIRLYSVVPLNEECGLIEWVPNLVGLRPVLLELYKQIGKYMKGRELKQFCCQQRDPLVKKREIFTKVLLPRHPPILGEWFRKTFPDAQGWLTARTAYIRTTAVISIVGYILGLGDRHGENILLDSTSGDTVHVDFNCLFNKGETFEWPERVPFRLTQNMVAAMGPLKVEGVFRKSCACTLRVLRMHSNTLMSIVTPFVYDPLVSWPRNAMTSNATQPAERTNEQAVEHVRNIELRLQGIVRTKGRSFSIPLSVEGQTNILIQEAMSVDNLCQMYIGWGPYL